MSVTELTSERIHRHTTGHREEGNHRERVRESPHMRMATRDAPASPSNQNDVNRNVAGQGNARHRLGLASPGHAAWCRMAMDMSGQLPMACNMTARRDTGRAHP